MSFVSELKRRNVLRIAAAYIAVSWLLIQVTETLFPIFGLSDAAIRIVVILLGVGFIPAVVVAWAFELTPEGLRRDSEVTADATTSVKGNKRLDRLIAVVLAIAVAYFAVDKFVFEPARDRELEQTARAEGEAAARRQASDGPPMVAVLPFVTTGPGEDSEFFAAGIHEDLLTQLAQLPSLRVISRTSVMEYKNVERNLREIGEALGADAILEGRVQSAGDRIRINAQLIDAKTDEHLWAETFDGDLTPSSIFDLQTDIARAITSAMHVTLNEASRALRLPTENMAAYRLYHEALAMSDESRANFYSEEFREKLRQASELDPSYTRPQAQLVGSYSIEAFNTPDPEAIARAEEILRQIERVAPGSADHLIAQAFYTYYILKDYELAHEIANRAIELTPSDERLIEMRSWIERRLGDYDAMLESIRLARSLSPRNPRYTTMLINNLSIAHRYDEVEVEIEAVGGSHYWPEMLGAYLELRHERDTARFERRVVELAAQYGDQSSPTDLVGAFLINRNFDAAVAFVESTPDPFEGMDFHIFGVDVPILFRLLTYHAAGDDDKLAEYLVIAEQNFEGRFDGEEEHHTGHDVLGKALFAAMRGNATETERLVLQWRRGAATDFPNLVADWGFTCELLGIANLAEAAVDCLRTGFDQPSRMMHFVDPYLPSYDSIRDEQVFKDLIAELESKT